MTRTSEMRLAAGRMLGVVVLLFALAICADLLTLQNYIVEDDAPATIAQLLWAIAAIVAIGWIGTAMLRWPAFAARGALAVVVIAVSLRVGAGATKWDGAPSTLTLDARQRAAFDYLRNAEELEWPIVGFAAVPSRGFIAMRILGRSRDADAAFKWLVESGTIAGKLYGLIGVSRSDPSYLRAALPRFVSDPRTVRVSGGCVTAPEVIASIARRSNAVQLPRGQPLDQWVANRDPKVTFEIDIAGGGYGSIYFDGGTDERIREAERTITFRE
jgi:hypothetical protein